MMSDFPRPPQRPRPPQTRGPRPAQSRPGPHQTASHRPAPHEPAASHGPNYKLAPYTARLLGGLIDYAIPTMVVIFAAFIPVWWIFAIFLFGTIGFQGWNQWTQGATGQSMGKKLSHTMLVRSEDTQPVGALIVIARYFLHALDWVLLAGFLLPIWDKKRQTLADKLVQTLVIEETY